MTRKGNVCSAMIDQEYVLFTRIPFTRGKDGRLFCDPLWAKDLKLHLGYLSNFRICCPVVGATSTTNLQALEDVTNIGIKKIIELRADRGWLSVARNFFPSFFTVLKACKSADIVHSGGAGWAFPLSFYILVLRPFTSFQWITVIESSFWMRSEGEKLTLRRLMAHHLYKFLLTRCVRSADARIFTQSGYRKLFLKNHERTLVAPAVWIDEAMIASRAAVIARASKYPRDKLSLVFPARLVEDKGVLLLFEAISLLQAMKKAVEFDIIGSGPLSDKCRDFAAIGHGSVTVTFHEPVEYGMPFLQHIAKYDAVLVPNLKEEQPRIIFDAFCQGLPVIASDTSGIRDITEDGKNSLLFKRGDAGDLARVIARLAEDTGRIPELGLHALTSIANRTHAQMHLDREEFLKATLSKKHTT